MATIQYQRTQDQGDMLVSTLATRLLFLVARITLGFVRRVWGVKMLMRGLFSEFLNYYLSLITHSLADVERRQRVNRPKTGIADHYTIARVCANFQLYCSGQQHGEQRHLNHE